MVEGYWLSYDSQTLVDNFLPQTEYCPFSFENLFSAIKTVGPKFLKPWEVIQGLFSTTGYVGFKNGTWDLKSKKLLDHSPPYYLSGILPFDFFYPESDNVGIQDVCPKICNWILDRVNGEEIYANIIIGFLLAAIINIKNPKRFLILRGFSPSGKSTALNLFGRVVHPIRTYVTGVEGLNNFWVSGRLRRQEFSGLQKTLIMCQDVGNSIPTSFVNLLRNLVSSGETQ